MHVLYTKLFTGFAMIQLFEINVNRLLPVWKFEILNNE